MNTINLIIGIALLACILTPAYVLYFLKYQLFANQKKHKAVIDSISTDLSKLHYEVEKIQFDEVENRIEKNKEILEIKEELVSSDEKHSVAKNTIEDMKVRFDYLRRTSNDDISKVNERVDLTNATHVQLINNLERRFVETYETEWVIQRRFNKDVKNKYEKILKQLDSLQSLNMTTQQILKRINSKEFAQDIMDIYLTDIIEKAEKRKKENESKQNDVQTTLKPKRGRPSKTELAVSYIKQKQKVVNQEQKITTTPNIIEYEDFRLANIKKTKHKSKLITEKEIEQKFKEKTGLTFYGYVQKYGQQEFLKKRGNIYDSVYYQKFTKNKK